MISSLGRGEDYRNFEWYPIPQDSYRTIKKNPYDKKKVRFPDEQSSSWIWKSHTRDENHGTLGDRNHLDLFHTGDNFQNFSR